MLYGGGDLLLYSGGLVCIVEARSASQIWEACVCIAEAHGVCGVPSLLVLLVLTHRRGGEGGGRAQGQNVN